MDKNRIIHQVSDSAFKKYGRILNGCDTTELLRKMQDTVLPEDVIYVPSVEEFEKLSIAEDFKESVFGGLPVQIGYCNGNNTMLNAVEYHRSSEINIAVTDLILLLGSQQDIKEDYTYDTANIEAFLVPAGTMIECYATTLHYAPCNADETGFRCVVVLPKDTNTDLDKPLNKTDEDRLLFAKNKWLIGHKDSGLEEKGAFIGLVGENISLK
ncbi:MAG: hypothetical protein K0S71_2103 [Clostridia bacterium]|jgi:hypothetical protein|nr:hypothetical protein [Clostridia bacterium]